MSPNSFNRHIVEIDRIYNFLFFLCVCVCVVYGGHFPKSKPSCDLENGVNVIKI